MKKICSVCSYEAIYLADHVTGREDIPLCAKHSMLRMYCNVRLIQNHTEDRMEGELPFGIAGDDLIEIAEELTESGEPALTVEVLKQLICEIDHALGMSENVGITYFIGDDTPEGVIVKRILAEKL